MKTVLKLVIAAALLNALVRGGDAAWNYYQLKDAAERAVLFGSSLSSAQLHAQILDTAAGLKVPLLPENLRVRWRSGRRIAEASYTQPVEFFPNYLYPVVFSFNVESVATGSAPADEEYPPAQ